MNPFTSALRETGGRFMVFRSSILFVGALRGLAKCCFPIASLLLTSCFHRESPADLVIINGNEPESLDPALLPPSPPTFIIYGEM